MTPTVSCKCNAQSSHLNWTLLSSLYFIHQRLRPLRYGWKKVSHHLAISRSIMAKNKQCTKYEFTVPLLIAWRDASDWLYPAWFSRNQSEENCCRIQMLSMETSDCVVNGEPRILSKMFLNLSDFLSNLSLFPIWEFFRKSFIVPSLNETILRATF